MTTALATKTQVAVAAAPPIKWVGGKRQLVPELLKHVNATMFNAWDADFYEPFCGGAALFFALRAELPGKVLTPHLNDANPHLINVYTQIRDNVEVVVEELAKLDDRVVKMGLPAYYADLRDSFNRATRTKLTHPGVTAWFIGLNAHCFNGLYRVNKSGGFNVPVGKFTKTPVLMDKADNLRAVSRALAGVEITCGDFATAVEKAEAGDLVYFDPPYFPAGLTSDFTSYTADGFGGAEQARLRLVALELVERGVHVILSNSDTIATRALYRTKEARFDLHEVQARRAVNSDATKRGKVGELIMVGRVS